METKIIKGEMIREKIFSEVKADVFEGFHPLNMMATMIPDINAGRYPMCLPEALLEMFRDEQVAVGKDQVWVFVLDDEFFANTLTKMIVRAAASRVVQAGFHTPF